MYCPGQDVSNVFSLIFFHNWALFVAEFCRSLINLAKSLHIIANKNPAILTGFPILAEVVLLFHVFQSDWIALTSQHRFITCFTGSNVVCIESGMISC